MIKDNFIIYANIL